MSDHCHFGKDAEISVQGWQTRTWHIRLITYLSIDWLPSMALDSCIKCWNDELKAKPSQVGRQGLLLPDKKRVECWANAGLMPNLPVCASGPTEGLEAKIGGYSETGDRGGGTGINSRLIKVIVWSAISWDADSVGLAGRRKPDSVSFSSNARPSGNPPSPRGIGRNAGGGAKTRGGARMDERGSGASPPPPAPNPIPLAGQRQVHADDGKVVRAMGDKRKACSAIVKTALYRKV